MLAPNLTPKIDVAGEILLDAADILERDGWCRHRLQDPLGRMCLYGAIIKAHNERAKNAPFIEGGSVNRLQKYLSRDGEIDNIADWNDGICGGKEEAIQALRGAAWSGAQAEGSGG